MVAEIVTTKRGRGPSAMVETSQPMRLMEIEGEDTDRIPLPIHEFSRVLGGGVVPGSVVLIGGDPGIEGSVLYISGEESERQIKNRVLRILHGGAPDDLYLLTETSLEAITPAIERTSPIVVVIDSIQTTHTSELDASAGSISQVRECASRLQTLAKSSGVAVFLVGHVTKEGAIAGPKVLEHIVDTVLYLEGDSFHAYRLLRSVKNRFGPTTEVGVFEMGASGMEEVPNPSETFLAERVVDSPGSAIAVTMEGTRPLLVEIQGLTSATSFGHPRRTANGVDFNRLLLTIAVLSRRVGLRLSDQDVFVNVVGGLRISEPAADLAVAAAISSSVKDLPLPGDVAFIGEVGLSGELRTVPQIPARLSEASKLGFQRVVIPQVDISADLRPESLQVIQVRSLREALAEILRS